MLLDNYTLTKFIGKGTFGEVYLTKKQGSDFLYATKRMSVKFVEDPKYIKYFNNEISILRKLYHKNIIKLEELKKTTNHYYVIMEYCNGGTLTECLEKYKSLYRRPFTEEIVQHIMRQVVDAVNYMHDLKIIHRDLKLENILVKFENEIDKNQMNLMKAEIKIIDFGFAAYKEQTGLLKTAIGSPMNMDPLILAKFNSGGAVNKELGYDEKADIWSLGTLCYQMLIGECAFNAYNMKELLLKVEEGTYKVPTNLSKEVVSFLNAMLQYKPEKRLSARQLIKHAFLIKNINDFTRINVNKVSNKVYNGELKINIKDNQTIWSIFNEDDQSKLNKIPGEFFPCETPITESQYLEDVNKNGNNDMITKEPFNLDKITISKQFTQATSIPIEGFNGQSNSTPIPSSENVQNNIIGKNNEELLRTPSKNLITGFQNNNFQNPNLQKPQLLGQNCLQINGNNMNTVEKQLNNGQIVRPQIAKGPQFQPQMGQNGQIQNQMNLIPKTPIKAMAPNNINQVNPKTNQHPRNLPQGLLQQPNGPLLNKILPIAPNQLQFNIIPPNQITQNQILAKNQSNKIPINQKPQMNKAIINQINNIPNIPQKLIGMNKKQPIAGNKLQQQDNQIRKVITFQQKNTIQNPINPLQVQINQAGQIIQPNKINQPVLYNNLQNKNQIIQPQFNINPQKNIPGLILKTDSNKINQVKPLLPINNKIGIANGNNGMIHNRAFNNRNVSPIIGKLPNNNNILLPKPIQRNGISPNRIIMKPTFPPMGRPAIIINPF